MCVRVRHPVCQTVRSHVVACACEPPQYEIMSECALCQLRPYHVQWEPREMQPTPLYCVSNQRFEGLARVSLGRNAKGTCCELVFSALPILLPIAL